MGFCRGVCFTRQNYSLALNHVKNFPLLCHCYFLISEYDLHQTCKNRLFFCKNYHCIWSDVGPGLDINTMKTPGQICAASVWIWKGGIKKNSWNIFSKISPNLFRKAVHIDKDWPVIYLWRLPIRLSNSHSLFLMGELHIIWELMG